LRDNDLALKAITDNPKIL